MTGLPRPRYSYLPLGHSRKGKSSSKARGRSSINRGHFPGVGSLSCCSSSGCTRGAQESHDYLRRANSPQKPTSRRMPRPPAEPAGSARDGRRHAACRRSTSTSCASRQAARRSSARVCRAACSLTSDPLARPMYAERNRNDVQPERGVFRMNTAAAARHELLRSTVHRRPNGNSHLPCPLPWPFHRHNDSQRDSDVSAADQATRSTFVHRNSQRSTSTQGILRNSESKRNLNDTCLGR